MSGRRFSTRDRRLSTHYQAGVTDTNDDSRPRPYIIPRTRKSQRQPVNNVVASGIGVPGHVSLNVRDVIAGEEDIFRYRTGNQKWYIPSTFRVPTASYDVEVEQRLSDSPLHRKAEH